MTKANVYNLEHIPRHLPCVATGQERRLLIVKNSDIDNELKILRDVGGFALLDNWSIIEVQGADAQRFLQARVTSDVKALKSGDGQESALLDRKAHLLAYFSLYLLNDTYWIICTKNQSTIIAKELETYLFAEKVTIHELSANKIWTVQGAYSNYLLSEITPDISKHQIGQVSIEGQSATWISKSITGELGFFLIADKTDNWLGKFELQAHELGMVMISEAALNTARIEAGLPLVGTDVTEENILPETSLDALCVSYTKGCYLGQEVIARVKAQGAPRRGLMGLVFAPGVNETFAHNSEVLLDGKAIGQIKSNVFSSTLKRTIALILITREYRVPDKEISVEIAGSTYKTTVITLPFYTANDNSQKAQTIYDSALLLYTKGNED